MWGFPSPEVLKILQLNCAVVWIPLCINQTIRTVSKPAKAGSKQNRGVDKTGMQRRDSRDVAVNDLNHN